MRRQRVWWDNEQQTAIYFLTRLDPRIFLVLIFFTFFNSRFHRRSIFLSHPPLLTRSLLSQSIKKLRLKKNQRCESFPSVPSLSLPQIYLLSHLISGMNVLFPFFQTFFFLFSCVWIPSSKAPGGLRKYINPRKFIDLWPAARWEGEHCFLSYDHSFSPFIPLFKMVLRKKSITKIYYLTWMKLFLLNIDLHTFNIFRNDLNVWLKETYTFV